MSRKKTRDEALLGVKGGVEGGDYYFYSCNELSNDVSKLSYAWNESATLIRHDGGCPLPQSSWPWIKFGLRWPH